MGRNDGGLASEMFNHPCNKQDPRRSDGRIDSTRIRSRSIRERISRDDNFLPHTKFETFTRLFVWENGMLLVASESLVVVCNFVLDFVLLLLSRFLGQNNVGTNNSPHGKYDRRNKVRLLQK